MERRTAQVRESRRQRERDEARKLEARINRLNTDIQKFRIDAQRFFAGDLKFPPDELRENIQTEIRRLRNAQLKGAAVNFRLGSLEAQFNSHVDLFGRRMRSREMSARKQADAARQPALDPVKGVLIGAQTDRKSAEALYKGLYSAKVRKPKMDLERFRTYLAGQAEAIRSKTGCKEIQFRIAVEDGKMKLKAKPIRRPS